MPCIATPTKAGFTLEEDLPGTMLLLFPGIPHETTATAGRFIATTG